MGLRRGGQIVHCFQLQQLEPRRMLTAAMARIGIVDPIIPISNPANPITIDDTSGKVIALRDGSVNGTLLTYTGSESADQYTAKIDWGDEEDSAIGDVVQNADGSFSVIGQHFYSSDGEHYPSIEIDDATGALGWGSADIITGANPMVMLDTGNSIGLTETNSPFSLATFYDVNPADASHYTATIQSPGGVLNDTLSVQSDGDGIFEIDADASNGLNTLGDTDFTVTITKDDGSTLSGSGTFTLYNDIPSINIKGTSDLAIVQRNGDLNGTLATFTGTLPIDQYTATIDWADGTTSDGTIVANADGSFAVTGAHHFSSAGQYYVSVEIDASDGSSDFAGETFVAYANPMVSAGPGEFYLSPGDGSAANDLGTIYDVQAGDPSDYTVTIDWGDGTSSAGSLAQNFDGSFEVYGDHGYAALGDYSASATVSRADGSSIVLTATAHVIEDQPLFPIDRPMPGVVYDLAGGVASAGASAAPPGVSSSPAARTPSKPVARVSQLPEVVTHKTMSSPKSLAAEKVPAILFTKSSSTIADALFAPDRKVGLLDDGVGNLLN